MNNQDYSIAAAIVDAWVDCGVGLAVGLDDPQAIFHALRGSTIRTVIVHDERSGAFLADGYSRASGRPSLCAGVTGPGATNLATGMFEAAAAHTPVIALVGESLGSDLRPAFQELAHATVLGSLAKSVINADRDPNRPAAAARFAAQLAVSAPTQPVLFLTEASRLWGPAPVEDPPRETVTLPTLSADPETAAAMAKMLAEAERPVIVAGNGVHLAEGYAALEAVAEAYRIPVVTTLLGKGAIDETHPLALGVASAYNGGQYGHGRLVNSCLEQADVLLVLGTDLDPITTSDGSWPADSTRLARIDVDERTLLAHGGLAMRADARVALQQILDVCPVEIRRRPWVDERLAAAQEDRLRLEEYDSSIDDGRTVAPARLIRELSRRLVEVGDAIVTDASYSSAWALDRVRQPWAGRHVFAPRGTGVLGWGLPAALGVQIARPGNRVACVTGDGGLLFSLAELETAVREQLPIVLCVLNNGWYGFQRHADIRRTGVDHRDLQFGPIDWSGFARATGWHYLAMDPEESIGAQLDAALARSGPVLVDVPVDDTVRAPLTMFDAHAAITH